MVKIPTDAPDKARSRRLAPRTPGKARRGFSLLETMVAISILSISLFGLAQLMLVSLQKHTAAEYNTKAVQVGRAKIEELFNAYAEQLRSGTTSLDLTAGPHGPEAVTLSTPSGTAQGVQAFVVRWDVTDLSGTQKTVVVTVDPPAGISLETRTVTLTTVLTS